MSGYLKGAGELLSICMHLPLRDKSSLFMNASNGLSPVWDIFAATSIIEREMSEERAYQRARIELNRPLPFLVMARAIAFVGGKRHPTLLHWIRRQRGGVSRRASHPPTDTIMIIQLNTDNHIDGHAELSETVTTQLEQSLARFADRITRVEVHFHDENGDRGGPADKTCVLEARLSGEDPVAVRHSAAAIPAALHGARDKMVHLLTKHYGKKRPPKGRDPFDSVTTL